MIGGNSIIKDCEGGELSFAAAGATEPGVEFVNCKGGKGSFQTYPPNSNSVGAIYRDCSLTLGTWDIYNMDFFETGKLIDCTDEDKTIDVYPGPNIEGFTTTNP